MDDAFKKECCDCDIKGPTNSQKWLISLLSGIIFLIIASPIAYEFTAKVGSIINLDLSKDGCANFGGLIIHSVVFMLIVRIMML